MTWTSSWSEGVVGGDDNNSKRDTQLQSYVLELNSTGTPMGSTIVMAAATANVKSYDQTLLVKVTLEF